MASPITSVSDEKMKSTNVIVSEGLVNTTGAGTNQALQQLPDIVQELPVDGNSVNNVDSTFPKVAKVDSAWRGETDPSISQAVTVVSTLPSATNIPSKKPVEPKATWNGRPYTNTLLELASDVLEEYATVFFKGRSTRCCLDFLRKIRLSPRSRDALLEHMLQAVLNPARNALIGQNRATNCAYILRNTDPLTRKRGFPFLGLPLELRQIIYGHLVGRNRRVRRAESSSSTNKYCNSKDGCSIMTPLYPGSLYPRSQYRYPVRNLSMLRINRQIAHEYANILYSRLILKWDCTCSLRHTIHSVNLTTHVWLREYGRNIEISWKGNVRDEAVAMLQGWIGLKHLSIILSTLTQKQLSPKEINKRKLMPRSMHKDSVALGDSYGLDALSTLRGLKSFACIPKSGEVPPVWAKEVEVYLGSFVLQP